MMLISHGPVRLFTSDWFLGIGYECAKKQEVPRVTIE